MNVKSKRVFVFGLLLILGLHAAPAANDSHPNTQPNRRYVNRPPQVRQTNMRPQGAPHSVVPKGTRKLQTDGGESYEESEEEPYDEFPAAEEPEDLEVEDAQIEHEEIKAAVAMIEFKLTEVNELIKECVEEEFDSNLHADREVILTECAGLGYQILIQNYKEGLRKVKQIFLEILRKKTKSLDEEYDDEVTFFLDTLEEFADKDFKIKESLEISKEAAKYYVSPHFYDDLIAIADPELKAFNAIHHRLHENKKAVQEFINNKLAERNAYLGNLDVPLPVDDPTPVEAEEPEEEEHHDYYEPEEEEEDSPYEEIPEEDYEESSEEQPEEEEEEEEDEDDGGADEEEPEEEEEQGGEEGEDEGEEGNDGEGSNGEGGESSGGDSGAPAGDD